MEIDIGELNKKIEIIGFDFGEDEIGQDIREEMPRKKMWAKVEQTESKETVKNLKNEAQEEKEFTIRYRKGIKKTMKIRYREKNYDITSIKNVDEKFAERYGENYLDVLHGYLETDFNLIER